MLQRIFIIIKLQKSGFLLPQFKSQRMKIHYHRIQFGAHRVQTMGEYSINRIKMLHKWGNYTKHAWVSEFILIK